MVRQRLARLSRGSLVLRTAAGEVIYGADRDHRVIATVTDARFFPAVAFGGHVGAAEAYAEGWWTTDDLTGMIRLFLRNRDALDELESGWAAVAAPLRRLANLIHRNTRKGSRNNIRAHYDLGNEFFSLFLDETLTYSCALFDRRMATLREASEAKYARMEALLQLEAADHVLEIGSGWGGFAIHAATHVGCRVTTTTISDEQYQMACDRVRAAGLEDRVTVLKRDYRDLEGTYDKLVSIEMIEAIGHAQYPEYFAKCASLLTPNGRAAIQAITIADERYEGARKEVDFIKRFIFPGSCIPSLEVLAQAASGTDLRWERVDQVGLHYAETLRRWRHQFHVNQEKIQLLGFDERFMRLWDFYFCYCEGGFLEGAIGTAQISLAKPGATPARVDDVPTIPSLMWAA
jgi:cyclopropane-fatty-acyl-phospholipid synthase